jgi:hypothetical protein
VEKGFYVYSGRFQDRVRTYCLVPALCAAAAHASGFAVESAGGLPDDGHPFHSGEERVANYWGVDTVFAKHCGVTRDPWGLVLTRGSRPAEGCVLLKCRVPRAISRSSARVCAEESEVVASASGIMFSRAIGLPENMLRTLPGLE